MSGYFTRRRGMGVVVLAEAFVVHPVRGGVGDSTANAIESILRRTGCSTLAVNWAKNGLDPSLCLHVLPANSHKSREPTSGLEPLTCSLRVITQALQGCAGDCECRICRGDFFLRLAECCTVLRTLWCQSGVNAIRKSSRHHAASRTAPDPRSAWSMTSRRQPSGRY